MINVKCDYCGSKIYNIIYNIKVDDTKLKYYIFSRNINSNYYLRNYQIVKCNNCNLVYTNPRLSSLELSEVYSSNKNVGGNWRNWPYLYDLSQPDDLQDIINVNVDNFEENINSEEWKVQLIEKYLSKNQASHDNNKSISVLDVGCGKGFFVKAMFDRGYKTVGCDISSDRVSFANNNLKLNEVVQGDYKELFSDKKFDIITLWDVIEHVEHPHEFVESLASLLNDNGMIFIYTMSLDSLTYKLFRKNWYYIDPIGHLFYFSDNTIKRLILKSGLKYLGKEYDDSINYNFKIFIRQLLFGFSNHFIFYVYRKNNLFARLLRILVELKYSHIPRKKALKRLESLSPYILPIRYKDNFIYVGLKK